MKKLFSAKKKPTNHQGEMHEDSKLLKKFNRKVLSKYTQISTTNLLCIVTENYLFELFIFYASVKNSWTFFPWHIYAFSPEKATVSRINELKLPGLEAVYLSHTTESGWAENAALKVELVEKSGIEQGIVSDLDNIFVAEIPELQLFLNENDFVFIGAPHSEWIMQTSLWSFRRTPATIRFAKRWAETSVKREFADASGLPFALNDYGDDELSILVLAKEKKNGEPHHQCPYDVQANIRPFELERDYLGYSETHMGRAKVLHFGGLRHKGNESVEARMKVMFELFPSSETAFPLYLDCANEAATILGMKPISDTDNFLRETKKIIEKSC